MDFNLGQFEKVRQALEKTGAVVVANAYVVPKRPIDYTIEATWPSGRKWEIVEIDEINK